MIKQSNKTKTYVLLFAVTYMISYITRINFGAIISEIEHSTNISKQLLSAALTGSFITYGAGQVISGFFGDRISPKKLILYGLGVTALMNILIPLCKTPLQMTVVWSVNGFAQAFMWPPMVRLMVVLIPPESYSDEVVKISWGGSAGTMAVYLFSPVIISFMGWKSVFFVCAFAGALMMLIWKSKCPDISVTVVKKSDVKVKKASFITPVFVCIMIAIVLQGMLRDGVTTWMPSYISETYGISNAISILSGAVLPVFNIICCYAANKIYTAKFKNHVLCAGSIFAAGAVSAALLLVSFGKNPVYSVLFVAVLTGCMHGVNMLLTCITPVHFAKDGNVSIVSGITNACTYIGSAISTYGVAVVTESFGWRITSIMWFLTAAAGTVICLVAARRYKIQ